VQAADRPPAKLSVVRQGEARVPRATLNELARSYDVSR
jgi:hypothetical protein